jgi:glycosyltransferase involved in cell wall biosynthesis
MDGGSDDGTAELVAEYPDVLFSSEKDKGIYHAVNKGIARARGDIVGWLNSDDRYVGEQVIAEVVAAFCANPNLESVCGGIRIVEGQRVIAVLNEPAMKSLDILDVAGAPGLVNARFFRRSVFERVGLFDTGYPIASDKDFLLRAHIAGVTTTALPNVVYEYLQHPGSITLSGLQQARFRSLDECLDIALRYWRRSDVAPDIRKQCRRWHGWLVGWASSLELSHGQVGSAFALARTGFRHDPAWPVLYVAQLPSYVRWRQAYRASGDRAAVSVADA